MHIFFHSGFLSYLRWKTKLPWNFSLFWNIFYYSAFWATCACPENRICPEIFQAGGGSPHRLVRLWGYGIEDGNTIFYVAWKMTISKRLE